MATVEFKYQKEKIKIQCWGEEKMKDIFERFSQKTGINTKAVHFIYNGFIINEKLLLSEIYNSENKKPITIILYPKNHDINFLKSMIIANNQNPPQKRQRKIKRPECNEISSYPIVKDNKSKSIICPECKENARYSFDNYKFSIYGCRNNHRFNDLLFDDFEKKLNYDCSKIICEECKNINKNQTENKIFYKCLSCDKYLCPFCKKLHKEKCNIIDIDNNYKCLIHNSLFSSFCLQCKINLCNQCLKENHKNHDNVFFRDILPDKDKVNNELSNLKTKMFDLKIKIQTLKNKLNRISAQLNKYYELYNNLIENYNNNKINYEILKNINEININSVCEKIDDIHNSFDSIDLSYKIYNIDTVMQNINKIIPKDLLTMKYHISKKDKEIIIFGSEFVKRNKFLFKILFEGKEYELTEKFNVEKYNKNYLEIKLIILADVTDLSYMFYNCSSLLEVKMNNQYDFHDVKNMSSMFFGCSLLESISIFKDKILYNATDTSFMFALCSNLDFSFLKSWEFITFNAKDMNFMFCGCNKLKSMDINAVNAINMSGMFFGCSSLNEIKINHLNVDVINMSQMFRGCKNLINLHINNPLKEDQIKIKDISGMFSECDLYHLNIIENLNTNSVINMSYLFSDNKFLLGTESINWTTENVINISSMFAGCSQLKNLSFLENISTENVIKMSSMFKECLELKDLSGIAKFKTGKVIDMSSLFSGCSNLQDISPISNWDLSNVIFMQEMFSSCENLKKDTEIKMEYK